MSRRIENRIEVPGTPEQVWEAIATGPGIEAWFVPARVEDGRVALDMGSGLEDAGVVTEFSPPHRFVYEEAWEAVEGEPPAGSRRSSSSRRAQADLRRPAREHALRRRRGLGRGAREHGGGLERLPAQPARPPHALPRAALRHGDGVRGG